MKWHEFIGALVERAGGESAVVRAMGISGRGFQGTLYKVAHGLVSSPKRPTAEKIAKHFEIDVDALYSDAVARKEAARLGLLPGGAVAATPEPGVEVAVNKHSQLKRARVMTLAEVAAQEILDGYITVVATADLLPHTLSGFDVRINTEQTESADGVLIMVRLAGGSCELGVCRMTVSGFEVDIGRGVVLDSSRHGLIVLGTATETRRVFARMR
jgi:hypothetical protein